jgi:hypothetical protein
MDGYAQSDPLSESLGLPPELADQIRKRGGLPRLLNIGQDEYFGSKPETDSGTPRLAQLMNQSDGASALNTSADEVQNPRRGGFEEWRRPLQSSSASASGGLSSSRIPDRIEDDKTRHPQGLPSDAMSDLGGYSGGDAYMPLREQIKQMQGSAMTS